MKIPLGAIYMHWLKSVLVRVSTLWGLQELHENIIQGCEIQFMKDRNRNWNIRKQGSCFSYSACLSGLSSQLIPLSLNNWVLKLLYMPGLKHLESSLAGLLNNLPTLPTLVQLLLDAHFCHVPENPLVGESQALEEGMTS